MNTWREASDGTEPMKSPQGCELMDTRVFMVRSADTVPVWARDYTTQGFV